MYRLVSMVLSRPLGRLVLGVIVVIGGIIYGLTSHHVAYTQAQAKEGTRYHLYVSQTHSNEYYVNFTGSDTYYDINATDFSSQVNDSLFKNGALNSLTYGDDSTSFDMSLTDGTRLSGNAYKVVFFSMVDDAGANQKDFKTAAYTQDPTGYYQNNWLIAGIVIFIGLVLAALMLVTGTNKQRAAGAAGTFGISGQPAFPPPPAYPTNPAYNPQAGYPGAPGEFVASQNPAMPGVPAAYGQPSSAVPPTAYATPSSYPGASAPFQPPAPQAVPSEYVSPQRPAPPQPGTPPYNPHA